MPRSRPSRGFEAREEHRAGLLLHAVAMMAGLAGAALANRFLSPGRPWFQWVALAWGAAFAVHLWRFTRGTLGTMGGAAPPAAREGEGPRRQ